MFEKILPITYLNWVLLWINAIKDAYLWIDSPDCFFIKADNIQWNHDINSYIRKANWEHKFLSTISNVDNIIDSRNSNFEKTLSDMCSRDFTSLIFVSSMPMNQLVGVDYEWLINNILKKFPHKSVFNIPSRSMTSCWLDWYSDLLFSLAKNIDINWAKSDLNNVAIIGNLFDRNEWDCIWNIDEIINIFSWLWLKVVSIWLDWWTYEDILKVKNAWTIISLPYGRKAAKKIANRLNIWLLELDLPFWINNTIEFINNIWSYFNINKEVIDKFIFNELKINNDIWILKFAIGSALFNKKISYYGDPYLLSWIIDFKETFWFNINDVYIHWELKHLNNNNKNNLEDINNIVDNFTIKDINLNWVDLFITLSNSLIKTKFPEKNKMYFWFPSYYYHCFSKQPYYWIKWGINFINRIFNELNFN